jgi:hypothetical protein
MSLVPFRLRRLGGSLRSLLIRRLRVTQVGWQWHVVLEPSPTVAAGTQDQAVARHLAAMSPQRRHRMRAQLSQLLRRHPRARSIFRHLAAVEHSLRAADASVFVALPPAVLRAAQEQLYTLVTDWTALGLHDLRATLLCALKQHGLPSMANLAPEVHPIDFGRGVQVRDASVFMFIEAERGWFPVQEHQ